MTGKTEEKTQQQLWDEIMEQRTNSVSTVFPQIAYLFSNIIVRNELHWKEQNENVLEILSQARSSSVITTSNLWPDIYR
jgi:hypothetical protein